MITVLALAMIVLFIVLLSKKKLDVFCSLCLVPLVFGFIAALVQGKPLFEVFSWIKTGLFYSVNATTGKVSLGVISPALLILFAVLYFDIMLNTGLFDPLCEFFIKKAKGDPLKVMMSTVLVASVVTLNGDTTTTILICLAAFLELYKKMNMSLLKLAIIIVMPIGIFNQLPWGGPSIACATALDVDIAQLFKSLLPGMLVAEVFVIFITYIIGLQERKRLNFNPKDAKNLSPEQLDEMLASVRESDPELKRPKLFAFNLILTIVVLALLLQGAAHGAILFMVGAALALVVNYRSVSACVDRINALASDALLPAVATFAAGVFSGVLGGSGMSTALAQSIAAVIPASLGIHMAPIYAIISAPAICFLPQDAFYFGIASVLKNVMGQFGITAQQAAVASMVGQSFRLISPVIPALFMLCERTKTNFVTFQKEYCKYAWPILFIYLFVHTATGAMPF